MGSAVESGWVLTLSLATTCGGGIAADPSRLLAATLLFLLAYAAAVLLYWAVPGGPAWGKHRLSRLRRPPGQSAIPGPRGLPVVGSMGLMTGLAHRKLAAAAAVSRAERLMAFSIGGTRAVVTAHPDVAREILSGPAFADRPVKESAYGLMFHRAIGFAPYGPHWRALRRVAAAHLFSPKQIAASAAQRAAIAAQMVSALRPKGAKDAGRILAPGREVEVRGVLKRASLHNVMWSVFGRRYELELGAESEETEELRVLVEEGYDILAKLNWSDHLPLLSKFDPQKIRFRCSRLVPRVNRFVNRIIQERRAGRSSHADAPTDFVAVLLSLQGSERLTDPDIVAVLWVSSRIQKQPRSNAWRPFSLIKISQIYLYFVSKFHKSELIIIKIY